MLELLDVVWVKKEYPELSLTPKNIGTIVDVHNGGEAYTVEFIDEKGETIEKAFYKEFTESELEYAPTKLDGGSLEERTKEMKNFKSTSNIWHLEKKKVIRIKLFYVQDVEKNCVIEKLERAMK